MDPIRTVEIAWTLFLQGLGSWLTLPMKAFTFLGQEEFFMLIPPVLYWCISPILGIRVGAMLILTGSLNGYAKIALHGPRPYWFSSQVSAHAYEGSFGLPSGHAQNAMGVWGLLAAATRKIWVRVLFGVIIFLIGLSRVYLGVHFTSDVIAGWLFGALVLWLFLRWEIPMIRCVKKFNLPTQIVLSLLTSLVLVGVNALFLAIFGGWQIPAAWIETARIANPGEVIAPFSPSGVLTNAGTWFGLFAGVAWLWSRGGYSAEGSIEKRMIRYLIGVAGVIVLWYGLGQVFPRTDDLVSYLLRYLRYTLVGLWISALAPMVFIRLRLAGRAGQPSVKQERKETSPVPVQ